jgi:hypothetical protein
MKRIIIGVAAAAAMMTNAPSATGPSFVGDAARFQFWENCRDLALNVDFNTANSNVEVSFSPKPATASIEFFTLEIIYRFGLDEAEVGIPAAWRIFGLGATDGASAITGIALNTGQAGLVAAASFAANSLMVLLETIASFGGPERTWVLDIETTAVAAVSLPVGSRLVLTGPPPGRRLRGPHAGGPRFGVAAANLSPKHRCAHARACAQAQGVARGRAPVFYETCRRTRARSRAAGRAYELETDHDRSDPCRCTGRACAQGPRARGL